ncbi:hypothetical protein OUZ56_021915 [Daphnia magna]|uniref:Uncharacterized protein n=1 Tax=Daphnia magna TaxID=35525 RepID=A0ABR0AUU3_9CRUS|nr:hypothetical protein OUZ56_021915 [Daphnia magna]
MQGKGKTWVRKIYNSVLIVFGLEKTCLARSVNIPGVGNLNSCDEADNCLLLKEMSVVVVSDFVKCPNNVVVIGKRYESQQDAYTYPCQSSLTITSGTLMKLNVNWLDCLPRRHWIPFSFSH